MQGDRRFLDRNIRDPGAAGVATRFIALDGLTPRRLVAPGDTMRCRYHDRGLAVQVAIDDYETQATLNSGGPPSLLPPWLPLESALGAAWREKLAEAGVRAAAQDLVALHLTCGISGGHRAFWDWMAEGSSELARSGLTELRTTAAKSLICTQTAEPANLETACYWNLFEDRWAPASGPILVSLEMRSLQSSFFGSLSRWGKLLTDHVAYAEEHRTPLRDPAAEAHYRAEIRRLIAAGCAAALPAGTLGRLRARADKGPTRTNRVAGRGRSLRLQAARSVHRGDTTVTIRILYVVDRIHRPMRIR